MLIQQNVQHLFKIVTIYKYIADKTSIAGEHKKIGRKNDLSKSDY